MPRRRRLGSERRTNVFESCSGCHAPTSHRSRLRSRRRSSQPARHCQRSTSTRPWPARSRCFDRCFGPGTTSTHSGGRARARARPATRPPWALDALAYVATCRDEGIPAVLERSRSGNGGHAWIFFSGSVPAVSARRLGTYLLRSTMARRAEVDLESYDRLFPSQDFVPKGSFGNLIALPLQGESRDQENTEFFDPSSLEPWPDQWAFLSRVQRLSPETVEAFVGSLGDIPTGSGAASWTTKAPVREPPAPARVRCSFGATIALERAGLPPSLLSSIKHLCLF